MNSFDIVVYDYESLPQDWKEKNPNNFEGMKFIKMGKIKGMKGHVLCLESETGKPYVFDKENLKRYNGY